MKKIGILLTFSLLFGSFVFAADVTKPSSDDTTVFPKGGFFKDLSKKANTIEEKKQGRAPASTGRAPAGMDVPMENDQENALPPEYYEDLNKKKENLTDKSTK